MIKEPFDFEAIVAGVDIAKLSQTLVHRSAAHVTGGIKDIPIKYASVWDGIQNNYDNEDYLHFMRAGIGRSLDSWDNRRKASIK